MLKYEKNKEIQCECYFGEFQSKICMWPIGNINIDNHPKI